MKVTSAIKQDGYLDIGDDQGLDFLGIISALAQEAIK